MKLLVRPIMVVGSLAMGENPSSWIKFRKEPMAQDALEFLRQDTKVRLDDCEKNKKIPQLYDLYVERLVREILERRKGGGEVSKKPN